MSRYELGDKRVEVFHFDCTIDNQAHGLEYDTLAFTTELILPAFLDVNLKRIDANTTYLFLNTRIVILSEGDVPVVCVAGQFVKKTLLTRQKVLMETRRELIRDERSIESSQDAFFIFLLNSCRLVYVSEAAIALPIGSFRSTIKQFLLSKHKGLVETISANHKTQIRLAKKRVETIERSLRNLRRRIASGSQVSGNSYQLAESRLNQELHTAVAEFEKADTLPTKISEIELLFSKPDLKITNVGDQRLIKENRVDPGQFRALCTSIEDAYPTTDPTRLPRQWEEDWSLYHHYALMSNDGAAVRCC